jgi:Uma2 family endonuclease
VAGRQPIADIRLVGGARASCREPIGQLRPLRLVRRLDSAPPKAAWKLAAALGVKPVATHMIDPETLSAADDGRPMTIEAYRALEDSDDRKWEYFGGRAFPWTGYEVDPISGMVGASLAHGRLARNALTALDRLARAAGCEAHSSEIRFIYDLPSNRYYYADAMAGCEPPIEIDGVAGTSAPCVIIEVLSGSNRRGRGRLVFANKMYRYLTTASVQTLLLIEQDHRRVHVYSRLPDGRMSDPREVAEGSIDLPCLQAALSLDDLYSGVID